MYGKLATPFPYGSSNHVFSCCFAPIVQAGVLTPCIRIQFTVKPCRTQTGCVWEQPCKGEKGSMASASTYDQEKIAQLRHSVSDLLTGDAVLTHWCDEACLRRFLASRSWNLPRAAKALRCTLEWRKKVEPHKVRWEDIEPHGQQGRVELLQQKTKDGRPIILYRLRCPMNPIDADQLLDQWIYWLESASHIADEEGNGSIVLVADFEQVPGVWIPGLRDRISCLRVAQTHYPERMGFTIVARPATLFWVLWYGMQPFIDPVTKEKIKFAGSGTEVSKLLADQVEEHHLYDSLGGSKGENVDISALRDLMKQVDKRREAHLAKVLSTK